MPVDFIKYAFVAGELSPTLFGRTDYEKYDFGLAEALNWFVDYRGGLSTRPGTQFCEFMPDLEATKFVPFRYAPDLANTYVIVFGDEYIRFLQNGAYVLEAGKTITDISVADPGTVESTAHGYTAGDLVVLDDIVGMDDLNGRTFQVGFTTANSFVLLTPQGAQFSTAAMDAYVSGGMVSRVYTVASPYTADDLTDLQAKQRRDYVTLTIRGRVTRNLVRYDHTDWQLVTALARNDAARPEIVSDGESAAGDAQVGFIVTAVFEDGTESAGSDMWLFFDTINYTATAGWVSITWDPVPDAVSYKVYRTNVAAGASGTHGGITVGDQVGFVGKTIGTTFTDSNIIPDFTRSPPQRYAPFANAAVRSIAITNGGSGYDETTTVSVTGGGGTGFIGQPIVSKAGEIVGVKIISGGESYNVPTVSFAGTGTGAAATATVSEGSGNYPGTSTIFQQRQYFAATENQPLTFWASRPGQFGNFDFSDTENDGDSFEHDLESDVVAPILHMIDVRGGLLMMTQTGIWLVRGAAQGAAVTATEANADPQSARGANKIPPLMIDNDIIYIEGLNPIVRLLSYSELAKGFAGQDLSILSNHLFGEGKEIVAWGYAQNPHNIIVAVRADGVLLFFTYVKEQDVFAWTPGETQGMFTDMTVVNEGGRDVVYLMVKRKVGGEWVKYIETMQSREFKRIEDAWAVDCGLAYAPIYPAASLTPSAATGTITLTASLGIFTSGAVGKIVRIGGGKVEVTGFTNVFNIVGTVLEEITDLVHVSDVPFTADAGEWSLDTPFSVVGGLHHLEGETVQILGDGNVMPEQEVVDGEVTLQAACTRAIVGLKYEARARTLPLSTAKEPIEHWRKSVVGVAARIHDTRGLKIGSTLDKLYPMRERTTEPWGQATLAQSGFKHVLIESPFDQNGQVYMVKDEPLPASVLGLVTATDLGDDD